jgi:hypothetical protein
MMNQRDHLLAWTERRLARGWFKLKASRIETHETHTNHGPRWSYGYVTLSAEPGDTFSFRSTARWESEDYTDFVLDGVLDAILPAINPILGVSVALTEVRWHEIDSCAAAYQVAATQAMKRILDNNMDFSKRHTAPKD